MKQDGGTESAEGARVEEGLSAMSMSEQTSVKGATVAKGPS